MFSPLTGAVRFFGNGSRVHRPPEEAKGCRTSVAIRDHIIGLEVIQRDTENIPPAPGFKLKEANMDFDSVTKIMREATKDAIAASKKKMLEVESAFCLSTALDS